MTLSFTPPKGWEDFEVLTKHVACLKLAGDFENYGRQGQLQKGIDIYGYDLQDNFVGIQCKRKGNASPNSSIIVTEVKKQILDRELKLADSFDPKLKTFILATTSFRDNRLQDHVNAINNTRINMALPKVILWTWEVFEEEMNRHPQLAQYYYSNILPKFEEYDKDHQILELLKSSLERPAFDTKFYRKNSCEDFFTSDN